MKSRLVQTKPRAGRLALTFLLLVYRHILCLSSPEFIRQALGDQPTNRELSHELHDY